MKLDYVDSLQKQYYFGFGWYDMKYAAIWEGASLMNSITVVRLQNIMSD